MTQQVRKRYRNHRKATWGLALVLVVAIAAVVIPLASGGTSGRPATWEFTGNASVCAGTSSFSFDVVLKNTSKTQNLGSADLYAPLNITVTDASITSGGGSSGYIIKPIGLAPSLLSGESSYRSLISPRYLTVGSGASVTVHVNATVNPNAVSDPLAWYGIAKQANQFNPGDLDLSNAFQTPPSFPTVQVAPCQYYFSTPPADAKTGTAQIVKVQLLSGTTPVSVPGPLPLDAYQTTTTGPTQVNSRFTGRGSIGGQDAFNTWTFSVTGNVSGTGYFLRAGNGTSSQADSGSFGIFDCLPVSGSCSSPIISNGAGSTAGQFNASGISSGIGLSFSDPSSSGGSICGQYWGWQPLTFPVPPYSFDGVALTDFSYAGPNGSLKVTIYFRNDLFVQTTASQTNDIQICVGAKHGTNTSWNGDPTKAWMGRNGILAKWDGSLYWGVAARISNCNKPLDLDKNGIPDPALCAWGTQTLADGFDYRAATLIVPADLDIQFKG